MCENIKKSINQDSIIAQQVPAETCTANAYQRATVCVPVTVTPFATPGTTTTYCCDDPQITPGTVTCGGEENGSCTFTITQDICVLVPVDFGAIATPGNPFVQCQDATGEDCTDCVPDGV